MTKEEDSSREKGAEILRQMREGTASKKHLDQRRLRAQEAVRRAIETRDESAYRTALIELGVDLESETGRAHLNRFRQLPPRR
jgi:hypothetical protein